MRRIESELYLAKQEACRLSIELNCQQHKYYNEVEMQRQAKDQEYNELKDKFTVFLKKYKAVMKEFASRQIQEKAGGLTRK